MKCWLYMVLILGGLSVSAQSLKHEFAAQKMGTQFRIVFYHHSSQAPAQLEARLLQRIDELNSVFSDYQSDSEASQLSKAAGSGQMTAVSHDLWMVILASQEFSKDTYGAFDVTVGPLSKLWRRAIRQKELPPEDQITSAKDLVNFRRIKLKKSKNQVELTKAGMRLDFGGIAKGYTLDALVQILQANGIRSYLVDAGGDIRVGLPPPEQNAWHIQIGETKQVLQLANAAIAASGDSYRYLEWEGEKYSHIIDPRTGYGVKDHRPVYIIAETGMTADALASAASILTEKSMNPLLKKYQARMWKPLKEETP
jgi:thiamine biosynthesis lipoprotein